MAFSHVPCALLDEGCGDSEAQPHGQSLEPDCSMCISTAHAMEKVNRYFLLCQKYNKHYQTFTHVGGAGSRVGDGLAMLSEWFGGEGGSGGSEGDVRLGAILSTVRTQWKIKPSECLVGCAVCLVGCAVCLVG